MDQTLETIVADVPKKLYSFAAVAGAAVAGSLVTAAGFVAAKVVEQHRAKKAIEISEPDHVTTK